MNQKSRQNPESSFETYFYKLMNNSNFCYNCRNSLDNCQFFPVFDELKEITSVTTTTLIQKCQVLYQEN